MADSKGPSKLPVTVQKPTPYTFDLGLLIANDPNPLLTPTPSTLEADLAATARDGAQALLNQLLGTCPIASTPNGVLLSLPAIETRLPREKVRKKAPPSKSHFKPKKLTPLLSQPLPAPAGQTKWERFAAKKGIKAKTSAQKQNLQYNEATGEWERKWGYKGANKAADSQWIVEVDEKTDKPMKATGAASRAERKERVRRNERAMRKNEREGKRRV
jgi:regulator of ribosome biosynthesis